MGESESVNIQVNIQLTMKNVVDLMNIFINDTESGNTENMMRCEEFLKNQLKIENVCLIYGIAIKYNQVNLMDYCEGKIRSYMSLKVNSTINFDRRALKQILKHKAISYVETLVFETYMSWLKAPGQQITRDIVSVCLGNAKLLSIKPSDENVIKFNRLIKNIDYSFIIRSDTTTFSIDTEKPLLLCYFVCAPVYDEHEPRRLHYCSIKYTITAEIRDVQDTLSSGTANIGGESALGETGIKVSLSEPIFVRPGISYKIKIETDQSVGIRHEMKREIAEPNINVKFYPPYHSWYNQFLGMIQELSFIKVDF